MSACFDCPRACGVDREQGQVGFCRVGSELLVAKSMLHKWEEPCISGKGGAGTVFFAGCNLRCIFCQNCDISHGGAGAPMTESELERAIFSLAEAGAECIELVTPTHYTSALCRILERVRPRLDLPIVWNSGGYESVESLRRLDGLVDVYMPDLKYHSQELASRYSSAPDYPEVAMNAIEEMVRQVGKPQFCGELSPVTQNKLKKGVIVRHLILPSHRKDSIDVLNALAREIGTESVLLSLMSQYTPDFYQNAVNSGTVHHIYSPLCRKITAFEYDSVTQSALDLGFDGYFQARSSATSEFTPEFK